MFGWIISIESAKLISEFSRQKACIMWAMCSYMGNQFMVCMADLEASSYFLRSF